MEGEGSNNISSSRDLLPSNDPAPMNDFSGESILGNNAQPPRGYVRTSDIVAARTGDPQALNRIVMQGALRTRGRRQNADQRRDTLISEIQRVLQLLRREIDIQQELVPMHDTNINGSEFNGEPLLEEQEQEQEEEEEMEEEIDHMHDNAHHDVEDMSHEEFLTLEEQIGSESTGLCACAVSMLMPRHIYQSVGVGAQIDERPCYICLDEYNNGEELGKLNCEHEFHYTCISQWLLLKNLCPVCKRTALAD